MVLWSTRTWGAVACGLLLAASTTRGALPCGLAAIPQRSADPDELGGPSLSADGRFLAFASRVRLLSSAADAGSKVYVVDLLTHTLTLESPQSGGTLSGWDSRSPRISGDGRFLVFEWVGAPVDPRDPAAHTQIMLRDRLLGTTRLLSVNERGVPGDHDSTSPVLSADGGVVAFESGATNLVAGADVNDRTPDVYVVAVATGEVSRASVDAGGRQHEGASFSPAISADGRYVAFTSDAPLGDAPGRARTDGREGRTRQVFVRDLASGIVRRVSRRPDGREPNAASFLPSISGDGRWVAFVSNATDIAADHVNGGSNIYLHDLQTSTTTLVSRSADGVSSDGASTRPALSGTGRFVVFESDASNLVCGKRCRPPDWDINLLPDVFVFDRDDRSILRLSTDPESGWMEPSRWPAVDASGRVVAFTSRHPIARDDTGNDFDIFVATRCGEVAGSGPAARFTGAPR